MFTVAEIAKRLKCSPALVYALCEAGKLSHHRLGLGRGTIRVAEEDLTAFLQESRVKKNQLTTAAALKHIRLPVAGRR